MSILQENFVRAARAHTWQEALLCANRLGMRDMLFAMEELPAEIIDELLRATKEESMCFSELVNMPRIALAATVIKHRTIPAEVPSDFASMGEVREVRSFLTAGSGGGAAEASLPAVVSRAGHLFPTPDAAACAAIDEIPPTSLAGSCVYGGRILQVPAGLYLFTKGLFTKGASLEGGIHSDDGPPLAGFTPIGVYHTRAPSYGALDEAFSSEDRARATRLSELAYLGSSGGKILRYTPSDMLSPEEQAALPFGRVDVLRSQALC
jgi:hypothetical protein